MINVAGGIQDTDACTSNVVRYEVDGAPKPGESSGWLRHDTFDAALADALDRGVLVITAISRDANGVAVRCTARGVVTDAPKRPRGRPPLDPSERRDARLTVRVTAATLADLEARAKREAKAPAVLAADILERAARR